MTSRTVRILIVNVVASLAGISLVIGGAEMYLRSKYSSYDLFNAGYEKPWFRANPADLTKRFMLDPEFGFRPIVPGPQYCEYGTLRNGYRAEKKEGVVRLLFVGDSVTRLGFIVEALRSACGETPYEFWNAGVDSFNTVQELNFYRKFNRLIQPDHVILTFHNNDFETTPIVFLNERGRMVLFSPFLPKNQVNEWLFRKSTLYRMWVGRRIADRQEAARAQIAEEVRATLREFQSTLSHKGIRFTVLVHPILLPKQEWTPTEEMNHTTALRILDELGIEQFDLSEPLWSALRDGINPRWDRWKKDKAHPSLEMARYFADYLVKNGLLAGSGPK